MFPSQTINKISLRSTSSSMTSSRMAQNPKPRRLTKKRYWLSSTKSKISQGSRAPTQALSNWISPRPRKRMMASGTSEISMLLTTTNKPKKRRVNKMQSGAISIMGLERTPKMMERPRTDSETSGNLRKFKSSRTMLKKIGRSHKIQARWCLTHQTSQTRSPLCPLLRRTILVKNPPSCRLTSWTRSRTTLLPSLGRRFRSSVRKVTLTLKMMMQIILIKW